MSLDPQFLRLLMETFQAELEDQLQQITDGLLSLEKGLQGEARQDVLNNVFRSAHNLKGSARGVDARGVAELAHQLESLFSALRSGEREVDPALVDLSLQAVDGLRELARQGLESGAPPALIERLRQTVAGATAEPLAPRPPPPRPTPAPAPLPMPASVATAATGEPPPARDAGASDAVRVSAARLQHIAALAEDLQLLAIAVGERFQEMQGMNRALRHLETLLQPLLKTRQKPAPRASGAEAAPAPEQLQADLALLRRQSLQHAKALRALLHRSSHLGNSLQGEIRQLQMVPLANLLRPLGRMVRDIGQELGKQVELQSSGDQIEVDRAVLDGLRDPLMHLLRNAIDHGLEPPAERLAAGKPEQGCIRLETRVAGGQIVLQVRDDGRGIDARRVGEIALRKKLLLPEELARLDEAARLALIFRPGFSSKEIITDLSGRGVGLDVVVANLRRLKGKVGLDTEPGRGSCFTLELPLTLSTERGLQVRAGGEQLLIPSTAVERILELQPSEVLEVANSQALLLGGRPVALRDLAITLALPSRAGPDGRGRLSVVVLSKGWTQLAFLVDEVVGEREIVIKHLPPPLQAVPNISGATLTGSGEIMMVLHVDELIDHALREDRRAVDLSPVHQEASGPRVLVCDDSITTRTLQKNLLEAQGYRVTLATDGQMGWELLQQQRFDIVITDVEMPRVNGFELTRRIRQSGRHAELPVVIVTSLARDEDRLQGVQAGADAYIVKSEFESRTLLDLLNQLV